MTPERQKLAVRGRQGILEGLDLLAVSPSGLGESAPRPQALQEITGRIAELRGDLARLQASLAKLAQQTPPPPPDPAAVEGAAGHPAPA